jgi:3-methyladenine DNA glycosylase AlkD
MKLSTKAEKILKQISDKNTKLGDLRTIAKDIKKDHQLAMELWSTEHFFARQLAILIMDKKLLSEETIDNLVADINQHNEKEQIQLIDWLFANQLTKDKKTIALIESWEDNQSSLKRRTYWYYQARLRWTGKPQTNSEQLLSKIEKRIESEKPEVQ